MHFSYVSLNVIFQLLSSMFSLSLTQNLFPFVAHGHAIVAYSTAENSVLPILTRLSIQHMLPYQIVSHIATLLSSQQHFHTKTFKT